MAASRLLVLAALAALLGGCSLLVDTGVPRCKEAGGDVSCAAGLVCNTESGRCEAPRGSSGSGSSGATGSTSSTGTSSSSSSSSSSGSTGSTSSSSGSTGSSSSGSSGSGSSGGTLPIEAWPDGGHFAQRFQLGISAAALALLDGGRAALVGTVGADAGSGALLSLPALELVDLSGPTKLAAWYWDGGTLDTSFTAATVFGGTLYAAGNTSTATYSAYLATFDLDGNLRDMNTRPNSTGDFDAVTSVAVSPDGGIWLVGTETSTAWAWPVDPATHAIGLGAMLTGATPTSDAYAAVFAGDRLVVAGEVKPSSSPQVLAYWPDALASPPAFSTGSDAGNLYAVAISATGQVALCGSRNVGVRTYFTLVLPWPDGGIQGAERLFTFPDIPDGGTQTGECDSLAFLPGGELVGAGRVGNGFSGVSQLGVARFAADGRALWFDSSQAAITGAPISIAVGADGRIWVGHGDLFEFRP